MTMDPPQALNWRGLGTFLVVWAVLVVLTLAVARFFDISPYGALLALGLLLLVNGVLVVRNKVGPFGKRRAH